MNRKDAIKKIKAGGIITHDLLQGKFLFEHKGKIYWDRVDGLTDNEFEHMFTDGWRSKDEFENGWRVHELEGWNEVFFSMHKHMRLEDNIGKTIGYNTQMMCEWLRKNYECPNKNKQE